MKAFTVSRRDVFASGVVFLSAAFLRLYNIGKQSLFLDEAWSWATSRLNLPALLRLSLNDPHPPIYYMLLKPVVFLLPRSESGLRALSALASLATLVIVMRYLDLRSNRSGLLFAGLLIAVSPFDIYYSQEARMYTLLGFFVICSYISLVKALRGDRNSLIVWTGAAILMIWTHVYGILYAFIQIAFLLAHLITLRSRRKTPFAHAPGARSFLGGAITVTLAAMPIAALALLHSSTNVGGAWIPAPRDLTATFLLWTVGPAPVNAYFLDGQNLALPFLARLPIFGWALIGLAAYGVAAAWGVYRTWREQQTPRFEIILSLALIVLPVALVYLGGAITSRRVWAFKSFLGSAYLFYLWAGIGIGSIKTPILRAGLLAAIVFLAGLSLWPYYSTWQKSNAASAFQSLPEMEVTDGILLEPAYLSPLAFYYADENIPLYAVVSESSGLSRLIRLQPSREHILGEQQAVSCTELAPHENLYIYEYNARAREALENWPECVLSKNLFAFQGNAWRPITLQSGG